MRLRLDYVDAIYEGTCAAIGVRRPLSLIPRIYVVVVSAYVFMHEEAEGHE
jgi:hypothetical protein